MTHEFDGRKYEQASTHQKEWGTTLIAELDLRGAEHVLDLGCGDGTLTARIAELLPKGQAVGVDVSRGMIEAARPKAKQNLRFILMDINDLSFSEEFDVVFSNVTLHWYMPAVDEYETLVESSGLREVKVWGENADRFFADADAMTRWIDQPSIVPFLSRIAEGQKREFRDYVVRRMIEETRQGDGRCFETFRRVNVSARKYGHHSASA